MIAPVSRRRLTLPATALAALLAAGCAAPPAGVPSVQALEVRVPVPVPCAAAVPLPPAWATEGLPAEPGLIEAVRALLAERIQRRAYQAELEAVVRACVEAPGGG